MRFPRSAKIFRGQVDVAPYLGVLFLLVLFLVFKSYIVHPSGIRIEIPEIAEAAPITSGNYLILGIDDSGRLYYESQILNEDELKTSLSKVAEEMGDEIPLLINADASVAYARLTQISTLAREAGITNVFLGSHTRKIQ